MKVFYSWQSDTPNNIGRAFIRDTLDAAIAGLEVEEAERPTIDQDTAGVLGSPVIADTIFKKIRNSQVIVADVTLTGQTPEGKRLANSNVSIELGFALGAHGDAVLLKVMNTHYGPPQDLPFDLAHRRWPVQFSLPPDAPPEERRKVRDTLEGTLRGILKAYMDANRPPTEAFARTASTFNPAAYWQGGETLATDGRTGHPLTYMPVQPLAYLRIWPREKIPQLPLAVLNDYSKSSLEPFGGGTMGWSTDRNRYGIVTYATSDGPLASTTQVFRNGEIWGTNYWWLRPRQGYPSFVPADAFESGLQESLARYLRAARDFGYPTTVEVEAGLVNVSDYRLAVADRYGEGMKGPIYADMTVAATVDLDKPETVEAALLQIYRATFEAAGIERPVNYRNFPAKR